MLQSTSLDFRAFPNGDGESTRHVAPWDRNVGACAVAAFNPAIDAARFLLRNTQIGATKRTNSPWCSAVEKAVKQVALHYRHAKIFARCPCVIAA